MQTSYFLFLILSILFYQVQCFNYLIMHPFYAGSHVLTLHKVSENLIEKGHKVTTVRFADPFGLSLKDLGPNFTEIVLHLNNSNETIPYVSKESKGIFHLPMEHLWDSGLTVTTLFRVLLTEGSPWRVVRGYCHQLLGNKNLIKTFQSDKYDVVLVDLIYNECALAIAHHLNVPTVGYWAFSFSGGEAEFSPLATPSSHIPLFMTELTDNMTFSERILNFLMKCFSRTLMYYHTWYCDTIISQYLDDVPSAAQLISNVNGALINTDFILDYPRLQPDTYLNIGGMQIARESKPLPKEIQDFMDGAKEGVVLFTMGFIFNPAVVPKERVDAFLTAFAKLPQRVIVKFDTKVSNAPPNVLVLPFLPQEQILAHPNMKVFLTHCGAHGVMEAIYHRVPMLGMPVFIDQGDVSVKMKEKGIAKIISKFSSSDQIYEGIVQVRDNATYKENIDKLSQLMKQRRNHPMDDAIWLMEFVAKTKGANHLLPSSKNLYLYQYLSLDVLAFFLVLMFVLIQMSVLLLSW